MTEFARLTAQFELSGFPEGLDALYDQYAVDYQPHALMRRGLIGELCARFDAGTQNERRLFAALDEIEGNPELLKLSNFLVNDMCAARHRLDLDDYQAMEPKKGVAHADLFSCLLLFACIEPSMQRMEKLGMPLECYEKTPFSPARRQLEKNAGDRRRACGRFPVGYEFLHLQPVPDGALQFHPVPFG